VTAERLDFGGVPLLGSRERQMGALRGKDMALIMQDPRYSLNPVLPIGKQVAEAATSFIWPLARRCLRAGGAGMLERVRIADPSG
jgi:peptide/nickel transport system ATP-binding protein